MRLDELRERFNQLTRQWREEVAFLSSPQDVVLNNNYQQIIGMGPAVVPLIMEELVGRGGHWFWALRAITQADPLGPTDHGNVTKMKNAWVRWWNENKK